MIKEKSLTRTDKVFIGLMFAFLVVMLAWEWSAKH